MGVMISFHITKRLLKILMIVINNNLLSQIPMSGFLALSFIFILILQAIANSEVVVDGSSGTTATVGDSAAEKEGAEVFTATISSDQLHYQVQY